MEDKRVKTCYTCVGKGFVCCECKGGDLYEKDGGCTKSPIVCYVNGACTMWEKSKETKEL